MDLTNKIALITGGSRGIGRAISLTLAEAGATVVVNYLRKKSAADELDQLMQSKGLSCRFIRANVEDEAEIDRLMGEITHEFGRLDILVSNAVFGVVKPVTEIKRKHWEKTLNTNAAALLTLAQRMAEIPGSSGGSIIALTSLGGQRVLPGYSVVGASKAAIESLVRYLAVELAPRGIRVNAIAPGVVETESLQYFPDADKIVREAKEKTPLKTLTTPEDVARLALFLCGDSSSKITGQIITIDGGYSLPG